VVIHMEQDLGVLHAGLFGQSAKCFPEYPTILHRLGV